MEKPKKKKNVNILSFYKQKKNLRPLFNIAQSSIIIINIYKIKSMNNKKKIK